MPQRALGSVGSSSSGGAGSSCSSDRQGLGLVRNERLSDTGAEHRLC